MKPLKLFVDAHTLDHGGEGVASFICGLYRALTQRHPGAYKVYLGCQDPQRVMGLFGHGADFQPVLYKGRNGYARLLYDMPMAIRKTGAQWAHFQYFTPPVKNCKWLVTIHDVLFNDYPEYFPKGYKYIRNILFPISARRADVLTTVSDYSRQRLSHWYGVDADRIELLPNGALDEPLPARPVSPEVVDLLAHPAGYLVCVSRFEPRKNQRCLLEAFLLGRFWERGIRLVFVGQRTLPVAEFDERLKQVPAQALPFVSFLSNLDRGDLQWLYQGALASVYPSFAEGFGMPPIESCVLGTPTISASTTAMGDFDFLRASQFDPADPHALAASIARLVDDPIQARDDARRASLIARNRYSWDTTAQVLHAVLSRG